MATKIGDQYKLNPHEVMAIGLGLSRILDDFESIKNDATIPWTPESRKIQKEIFAAATSAAKKIEAITGFECKLDAYVEGDENEFLTKES